MRGIESACACGAFAVLLLAGCGGHGAGGGQSGAARAAGASGAATAAAAGGAEASSGAGAIRVTGASYGANVDAAAAKGNATADIAQACDRKAHCDYKVDYERIGDPFPGKEKNYTVTYECGDGSERHVTAPAEAGLGSIIALQCP